MNKDELIDVFNAEPTRLTKEELIELGGHVGVKLTMRSKEATMIKKISEVIVPADAPVVEAPEIEVEVVDPEIGKPIIKTPPSIPLGRKQLDPSKTYILNLSQRTALRSAGQSVSEIPKEMTGAELMKFPQWKNLSL